MCICILLKTPNQVIRQNFAKMDNLDNWQMLSAFTAEETEEILTPAIITDFETIAKQTETIIKEEPAEYVTDLNESQIAIDEISEEINIKLEPAEIIQKDSAICNNDDMDDDAIFDFKMDSNPNGNSEQPIAGTYATPTAKRSTTETEILAKQTTSTGRPLRAATLSKTGFWQKHSLDEPPLDYESAIIYICPACEREYFSHEAWKRHLNVQHDFNTREGLNFVKVDKLYHRCRQCSKHIAMHSMENLMKHKFTHLPFRCAKCRICLRQYKYRQDLLVHLRMYHIPELEKILKTGQWEHENEEFTVRDEHENLELNTSSSIGRLAIMNIQENAVDLHSDASLQKSVHVDSVCVQNERLVLDDEDEDEVQLLRNRTTNLADKSLLESALNHNNTEAVDGVSNHDLQLCAPYIMHVCPQCGDTFEKQPDWQRHIEFQHNFGTSEGLGFKVNKQNEQAMCLECAKVVYNELSEMQAHRFTHSRHRLWLRCSLCYRAFTLRKDLVRHLLLQHLASTAPDDEEDKQMDHNSINAMDGAAVDRDIYEAHIDYLCPQCGRTYNDKKQWRRHLIFAHRLADLKILNFRVINETQVKCLECNKIITNAYGIHNAQQHRFTHMPHKAYIRCRICDKSYTDRKGCVKHVRSKHPSILQCPDKYRNSENINNSIGHKRRKEVVRTANYLYEIEFIDEQQLPCDYEEETETDDTIFNVERNIVSKPMYKCFNCAARFSNSTALQAHITEFHKLKAKKSRFEEEREPVDQLAEEAFLQQYYYFLCPSCGKQFPEQSSWRQHINEVHLFDQRNALNFKPISPYSYRCLECGHISDSKLKAMQEHMFRHLRYPGYIKCRLCGITRSKQAMLQHLHVQHEISKGAAAIAVQEEKKQHNFNEISTISLPRPTSEYTHNAVDHDTITYYCPACNHNFDAHYNWRRHIVDVHNLNNCEGLSFRQIDEHHYICLECYKRVTVTHTKGAICQLQSHKFRHLPYRSFKCTACNEFFVRKQMFFKHLSRFTNACPAGNSQKKITQKRNEIAQPTQLCSPVPPTLSVEVNDNDKSVDCLLIESNLTEKSGTFLFLCPACGQEFEEQHKWREHINIEHNLGKRSCLNYQRLSAKLHQCLQCGEQVHGKKLRDLQTHQFKHLPHTSYLRCTLCSAAYTHLRNMKDHMRNKHPEVCYADKLQLNATAATENDEYDETVSIKSSEEGENFLNSASYPEHTSADVDMSTNVNDNPYS